jgi:integrase
VEFQRIEAMPPKSSKRPNKPKLKNQKQVDKAIRDSHGNPYHKHPIGRGLYLVTRGGAGFWHLQVWDRARQIRLKDGTLKIGTRTSIGLGRAGTGEGELTRDAAVKLADEKRVQVQKDGTVIRAGGRASVSRILAGGTGPTFQSLADAFLEAERTKYKDPDEHVRRVNYRRYWAALSDMPWTSIAPSDVAAVLKSEHVIRGEKRVLWEGADKKPGSLVRSLVERILGRAAALAEQQARATGRPIVPYSNPAALDVLQHYDLPKSKNGEKRHHPAIDWRKAPELWSKLASEDSARSRSLRFLMATGVRLEEAMQMTWREIDGDKVWHIPAGRMKGGKAHDVPLSDLAIGLVGDRGAPDDRVFPRYSLLLRYLQSFGYRDAHQGNRLATLHGMRTAFREWAAHNGVADRLAETVLAHADKDRVQAAYQRSTLVEPRRQVMQDWARFLTGQ